MKELRVTAATMERTLVKEMGTIEDVSETWEIEVITHNTFVKAGKELCQFTSCSQEVVCVQNPLDPSEPVVVNVAELRRQKEVAQL